MDRASSWELAEIEALYWLDEEDRLKEESQRTANAEVEKMKRDRRR